MGGVMLNDCLQVQQMQLEQMQQPPSETVDMRGLVTGPTTDLYSGKAHCRVRRGRGGDSGYEGLDDRSHHRTVFK